MSTEKDYKSQYGQDKYINEIVFKGKSNGTFLDIGAYDGVHLSNSYYFEKYKNWTGVCVEPNPKIYKQLAENRNCICLNAAVSEKDGKMDYLNIPGLEPLNGLIDKYDVRHMARIDRDMKKEGLTEKEVIEVDTINITDKLLSLGYDTIDYCNIDTEGGELSILKTIDLDRITIKSFSIENNFRIAKKWRRFIADFKQNTVSGYLKKKGYKKIFDAGADEIFILKDLKI